MINLDSLKETSALSGRFYSVLKQNPDIVKIDPTLIGTKITPDSYSPYRLGLLESIKNSSCRFEKLGDLAEDVSRKRKSYTRDNYKADYFVSILHLNDKGIISIRDAATHNPISAGKVCTKYDVLFSGINPSQNRVGVWLKDSPSLCSSEFAIFKPFELSPFYLSLVSRSRYCLMQIESLTRGTSSSRRRLDDTDLSELLIPVISDNNLKIIETCERENIEYETQATKLLDKAQEEIQALIDGNLDVNAIIAGHLQPPTWEDILRDVEVNLTA